MQKRRTLRRTLLQYQRDCQSLDAPTAGGASSNTTLNPPIDQPAAAAAGSTKLSMMTPVAGDIGAGGTGKQSVPAVSFKTPDAAV